jgi:hypothetical protein
LTKSLTPIFQISRCVHPPSINRHMVPNAGDIRIIFVQKMVLASGEGQYQETVACSGIYSELKEGKAALRKGKKIKEARIKLAIESDECEFTFKADSFQIQSMKLPATLNMAEEVPRIKKWMWE